MGVTGPLRLHEHVGGLRGDVILAHLTVFFAFVFFENLFVHAVDVLMALKRNTIEFC